jgi:lipopolysaccharide transport system permease protein
MGVLLWYGVAPGWEIVLAPFFVLGLVTSAIGVGTLLAALTVNYRDFRHVVPFLTQMWMFLTPSVYLKPEDSLSPILQAILPVNPAYGLILNFRVAILGGSFDFYALAVSTIVGVLLLVIGCFYFRRAERNFADVI